MKSNFNSSGDSSISRSQSAETRPGQMVDWLALLAVLLAALAIIVTSVGQDTGDASCQQQAIINQIISGESER